MTFFAVEVEFLAIFEDASNDTVVAGTVLEHFFIDVVRWLVLTPSVVHTPSFVFEDNAREFSATTRCTAVARDSPDVFLGPEVGEIR